MAKPKLSVVKVRIALLVHPDTTKEQAVDMVSNLDAGWATGDNEEDEATATILTALNKFLETQVDGDWHVEPFEYEVYSGLDGRRGRTKLFP